MTRTRLMSNAVANLTNGAATAAFQLGMTAVMARAGSARDLAVWSLAASLSGLAPLLGCNLSMGVARRLAAARQGSETVGNAAEVMAAATGLARHMTLLGVGAALLLGAAVPLLYPKITSEQPLAGALMVAAYFAGSCWMIAAQPVQGWLLDARSNWAIVGATAVSRAAALVAAAGLLFAGAPAWSLAAAAGMLLWIAVPLMARQTGPQAGQHVHAGTLHKEHKLLLRVSLGFAAWGASSAVIQGASVPLVAWLMPAGATPFFLAFTLVTVIIGAMMAAANALVSPVAAMLARAERAAAARLARRASAVVWLMANLALAAVYLALPQVLALWTGARGPSADIEAAAVRPYFALLALQHGIRSAGIVPSIVLAAGAVPRTLLRAVLPESSVAVLLALPLGFMMGPTGFLTALAAAAAAGTLAASAFAASGPLKSGQDASKHDNADCRVALMPTVAGLSLASVILWTAAAWSGWR